jgi:hypothetical protein
LKHKNTQPLYIFNRENPKNSEPQNVPRSGLDYIALITPFVILDLAASNPVSGCFPLDAKHL